MRIAVIGGGIFGTTAAIIAARAEHDVHLFEKSDSLMNAASAVNQFRLHRGYHYPRSRETGRQCRFGNRLFLAEYGSAIIEPEKRHHGGQFYAIAREGSRVSANEYLRFLDSNSLPYRIAHNNWPEVMEVVVEVQEAAIDPVALKHLVTANLKGVHVHLETELRSHNFDAVIVAAYASTNTVAKALGCRVRPLQYEICEKPVVRLPQAYKDFGMVVMDGPFCSIDPYGKTGLHVLGHVEHAIHETSVGEDPPLTNLPLNQGIVNNPPVTKFKEMVEAGAKLLPALEKAEHIGSMFTIRAVLPNKDATDERPTMVERLDDQVVRIFSGKIGTAVDAAYEALFMLERGRMAA